MLLIITKINLKVTLRHIPLLYASILVVLYSRNLNKLLDCQAIPVPHLHRQTLKKGLKHMAQLGILDPCGAIECLTLASIIPKKIQFIMDLNSVNKAIVITNILKLVSGYKCFKN